MANSFTHQLLLAAPGSHWDLGKCTSPQNQSAGQDSDVLQSGKNMTPLATEVAGLAPTGKPIKKAQDKLAIKLQTTDQVYSIPSVDNTSSVQPPSLQKKTLACINNKTKAQRRTTRGHGGFHTQDTEIQVFRSSPGLPSLGSSLSYPRHSPPSSPLG